MPRLSIVVVLFCCCVSVASLAEEQQSSGSGHYLFVWAGDYALQGNDFLAVDAGRTFIFDVRDPRQPKIVTSFTDMAGYMHPHSYQPAGAATRPGWFHLRADSRLRD